MENPVHKTNFLIHHILGTAFHSCLLFDIFLLLLASCGSASLVPELLFQLTFPPIRGDLRSIYFS